MKSKGASSLRSVLRQETKPERPEVKLAGREQLVRVTEYNFNKNDNERVVIKLYEIVDGVNKGVFFASPFEEKFRPKRQFVGNGNSPKEALDDCLLKIRRHKLQEIFEPIG